MLKKIINSIFRPEVGITYSLIAYIYLAAIHLYITFTCFHAETWYSKVTSDTPLMYYFVVFPIIFATFLFVGKIRKNIVLQKIGLGFSWAYHLAISLLNVVYYAGVGTPWLPALFVGVVSLILFLKLQLD